jgi:enoyl-CoA hydratase
MAGFISERVAGFTLECLAGFVGIRRGPIMIDLETDDGIAVVAIAHGKANALDIELCEALVKCFEELRASDVEAVVITGQGRMFSAGVDLVRVSSGGADYVRKLLPVLNRAFDAVFFLPKPVVAAVNGHAIAGGCVLTCCADRRLMARGGGRIGVTELLVGVPFPALAFEIVRAAVPARHLAEFTLGGATYEADEALSRGWVDEIMEADALMAKAMAAARLNLAEAETHPEVRTVLMGMVVGWLSLANRIKSPAALQHEPMEDA